MVDIKIYCKIKKFWKRSDIWLKELFGPIKTVDNIIIDMYPLVDAFEQQYKKKFTCDYLLCCSHS